MGAMSPVMLDMSLAPIIAQKRAQNLGIAESAAVVFAAQYEGTAATPVDTDTCKSKELTPGAWQVVCDHGDGKYFQSVTRGFRTLVNPQRPDSSFAFVTPASFSIWQCPPDDPFGVEGFNDRYGGWCVPTPLTHWGNQFPIEPEDWVYDLSAWFTGSATGPSG